MDDDHIRSGVPDGAGVEVVQSLAAKFDGEAAWTVDTVPRLVISTSGEGEDVLFGVGGVERLRDGRIVVENRGTRQLLVFDPSGRLVDAWGGRGDGPTEFTRTQGLFTCGADSLVVPQSSSVSVFRSDGALARKTRFRFERRGRSTLVFRGVSEDCRRLLAYESLPRWKPNLFGTGSYPRSTFWISTSDGSATPIGTFPGEETVRLDAQEHGSPYGRFPFNLDPGILAAGRVVYHGLGDRPSSAVLNESGEVVRFVRWSAAGTAPDDGHWSDYEAERRRYLEWDPLMRGLIPGRAEHPRPAWMPFYSAVHGGELGFGGPFFVDDERNLWIRQYHRPSLFVNVADMRPTSPAGAWWVFDPEGVWLTTVETPANFSVREIAAGGIIGVVTDELGVEELRELTLIRGARTSW